MSRRSLSRWQRQVLEELAAIAERFPGDIEKRGRHRITEDASMTFRLRVQTAGITHAEEGLCLRDHEDFTVTVAPSPLTPPQIEVEHLRFLGFAHVLQGRRLCLYLDPSREWDPTGGFGAFLDRLIDWLGDAAAGRFDPNTALYHPVGGVLHASKGAPTLVVRDDLRAGVRAQHGWLVARTPDRFDLSLELPSGPVDAQHVPILTLDTELPLGAGTSLPALLATVDNPYIGHTSPGEAFHKTAMGTGVSKPLLTSLAASALRKPDGSPQGLVIAVPHPSGGPPHLLAASLPPASADHLRALERSHKETGSMTDDDQPTRGLPLQWWPISDERAQVTTRRDSTRPVAAFTGKTVQIWGCGGLGSWIAEFVARAGARKIVLCDPGTITGGLLVRQNFTEADIGRTKVQALADRLGAISDSLEVAVHPGHTPTDFDPKGVDAVIDATVSVAIGRLLDLAAATAERPVLAQVATDARTGTIGLMTISMPPLTAGPLTLDRHAGEAVRSDGALEVFHELWKPAEDGTELIPTRGCSTPTFHGSAADLAAVAASLTSILAAHLGAPTPVSGTHLISLPHGEAGPLRRFIPARHEDRA